MSPDPCVVQWSRYRSIESMSQWIGGKRPRRSSRAYLRVISPHASFCLRLIRQSSLVCIGSAGLALDTDLCTRWPDMALSFVYGTFEFGWRVLTSHGSLFWLWNIPVWMVCVFLSCDVSVAGSVHLTPESLVIVHEMSYVTTIVSMQSDTFACSRAIGWGIADRHGVKPSRQIGLGHLIVTCHRCLPTG